MAYPKGRHHSEEHKKKISESSIGHIPWNKGKQISKETRLKISQSLKGRPSRNKGHHHSEETKQKMSEIRMGMKFSEETKRKMSENHADVSGKNHPNFGKKHQESTIRKMREARSRQVFSDKTCKKISESRKGKCMGGKHHNWQGGKKVSNAKSHAKQIDRGWILLFKNNPYNEPTDYHHIHPNLPYVIPCPKRIHKMFSGKHDTHYSYVNMMLGFKFEV